MHARASASAPASAYAYAVRMALLRERTVSGDAAGCVRVPAVTTSKHLSGCFVDSVGATSNLHISYKIIRNKKREEKNKR